MRVLCTAGHVDHGKSTLVRALTGMEPDRLAEEQQRGLTIDLGFAWTDLGDPPTTVAFVDLPGHERFVPNMLAGAGPVELALFVVAADEGWMPQSQEHLDILDLLGVQHGVVALTKIDAVDPVALDTVERDVRTRLAGTAFADVPVVRTSGVTGAGLDELVAALLGVLDEAPAPPDLGRARLWVDRVFTIHGAGTVVTGTLSGGRLAAGDDVAVLPGDVRARVRGLQMLGQDADEATPGSRVAVNLAGVERGEVTRGDTVVVPGAWLETTAIEGVVNTVAGQSVARKGAWHLHVGSARRPARVFPLDAGGRGGSRPRTPDGFVRIEIDRPVAVTAGDRFVLRDAGRRATVGGGVVIDPQPLPRARRAERHERARSLQERRDALTRGDRSHLLAAHVASRGADSAQRALAATGATTGAGLVELGGWLAAPEAVGRWSQAAAHTLAGYHREHPLARTAPKDVVARALTAAGCPPPALGPLVAWLVASGELVAEGPGVRLPKHRVQLDPAQAAAREALLAALTREPFAPPRLVEAAQAAGATPALVRELEAAGDIVRLGDDLAFAAAALEEAASRLRAAYTAEGPLTAARAKAVLGTTRKYALPLLEELDRRGVTRRIGDVRELQS